MSVPALHKLEPKERRRLWWHWTRLLQKNSWLELTPATTQGIRDVLSRLVRIDKRREWLLSESGYQHARSIASTMFDSGAYGTTLEYSDHYSAVETLIAHCVTENREPQSRDELVFLLAQHLESTIDRYTFIWPFVGVTIESRNRLALGPYSLCTPDGDVLRSRGVSIENEDLQRALSAHKHHLWLVGTVRGSPRAAEKRFRTVADQLAGMLFMYTGSIYEHGGVRFAFRAASRPSDLPTPVVSLSWPEKTRLLSEHRLGAGASQLEVNESIALELERSDILQYCFSLPAVEEPSDLEDGLLRAALWLDDASHDRRFAMRLLKLWSCAETFFSTDTEISEAVCTGVTTTLIHGPAAFVPGDDRESWTRRLKYLYNKRSRAAHHGHYDHVSEMDCAELTQAVCWMMVNVAILGLSGIKTIEEARQILLSRGQVSMGD